MSRTVEVPNLEEAENVKVFKSWLEENAAYVHPDIHFERNPYGFSVIAQNTIAKDTPVVSCPFSLAITPTVARTSLQHIFGQGEVDAFEKWSERQLICTYLCLHILLDESDARYTFLKHKPYVDVLPKPSQLLTSLHFSPEELEHFKGTNLYGATLDRLQGWKTEYEFCHSEISKFDKDVASKLTWDLYLTASTYLSSRAFPSTVLSPNPSLIPNETSHPVLLPGVDSLNHARAQPVSWVVSRLSSTSTSTQDQKNYTISLVPHTATEQGCELFNNYGPKPNSELILGYGFSLPNNPDDTIVLKIGGGGQPNNGTATLSERWEVGRLAEGMEKVWEALLDVVAKSSSYEEAEEDEQEAFIWLDAADSLIGMVEGLLNRLPHPRTADTEDWKNVRKEVITMFYHYLEGQRDILNSMLGYCEGRQRVAQEKALALGIDIEGPDREEGESVEG
ncbi:hypothetical protein ABKN59_006528 [Abortiporus biennis]